MNTEIQLFQTRLGDCPYLENRQSSNFLIDPDYPMQPALYEHMLEKGFRRSAGIVYRPTCPGCRQCKSTRVPVASFIPSRSQKRAWNKVANSLQVVTKSAEFEDNHYQLYQRYTRSRHGDSDMAESTPQQYMDFLVSDWSDTLFIELHLESTLMAVAVTDRQPRSLSALYTFYEPELLKYSPGVLAILTQINLAGKSGLDWLYLGYWVEGCQKMGYKAAYRPLQFLENDQWQLLSR